MATFEFAPVGEFLKKQLAELPLGAKIYEYGTVESCNGDVVNIKGLSGARYGEILELENGVFAMALDLHLDGAGAVLLNGKDEIEAGSVVKGTGRVASVGVGKELLGRIIDPLGRPLDEKPLTCGEFRPVEMPAPSIVDRSPVNRPLETGILAVDSMIPIGRGQRELIIGDRQTGKTSIALSAMIHQANTHSGVICIYCAIGQKNSNVMSVVQSLKAAGALENSVVLSASSDSCAALQYLAPYAACSIGEYFMNQGSDVLVVYDDLSKHAVAYRAMSLLLRRPAGREAYPGDVFYLHSRLLERAAKLSDEKGGGSMTALPIVETMAGDISAYIPTNVISITDGQIYLESELFNSGVKPAINVGLSVSRVGRSAQFKAIKKVSGALRLQIAQYRDLAVFMRFGSDMDSTTAAMLHKGEVIMELLKQNVNEDMSTAKQCLVLYAADKKVFDNVPVESIVEEKQKFLRYLESEYSLLLSRINTTGDFDDEDRAEAEEAFSRYQGSKE